MWIMMWIVAIAMKALPEFDVDIVDNNI